MRGKKSKANHAVNNKAVQINDNEKRQAMEENQTWLILLQMTKVGDCRWEGMRFHVFASQAAGRREQPPLWKVSRSWPLSGEFDLGNLVSKPRKDCRHCSIWCNDPAQPLGGQSQTCLRFRRQKAGTLWGRSHWSLRLVQVRTQTQLR